VQALPSLHDPPLNGVTEHELVPLHVLVLQESLTHEIAVPEQPPPEHWSECVQLIPSSHDAPLLPAGCRHDAPLHESVVHGFPSSAQFVLIWK
jgi:hypothetical protein